jgi:hypothetical protein
MSPTQTDSTLTTDEQAPEPPKEKVATRKGLGMDLRNGARVTGFALDDGGFEWIFTSEDGIKTMVRLSEDATYAIGLIAERLLNPNVTEAA